MKRDERRDKREDLQPGTKGGVKTDFAEGWKWHERGEEGGTFGGRCEGYATIQPTPRGDEMNSYLRKLHAYAEL